VIVVVKRRFVSVVSGTGLKFILVWMSSYEAMMNLEEE
jgi:hypothetical protein